MTTPIDRSRPDEPVPLHGRRLRFGDQQYYYCLLKTLKGIRLEEGVIKKLGCGKEEMSRTEYCYSWAELHQLHQNSPRSCRISILSGLMLLKGIIVGAAIGVIGKYFGDLLLEIISIEVVLRFFSF